MKNKKFLIYILVGIAAVFCCGCGGNADEASSQSTDTASTELTTEAPKDETEPVMDETGFYTVDDYVITTGETVNVRVEPDTEANIYKLLETGTTLHRTGYSDEWSRVVVDGAEFYVYSEFVEETEAPEEPATEATETDADSTEPEDGEETVHKIVIDPAKQASFDAVEEQVGPGSEETKSGVAESIMGTAYETKESELNLAIALLLKQELTDRGYEVVLTREDDNVDITNKARAELANDDNADIFVRIQMTESENADLSGTVAFCITPDTPYDSSLYEDGKALATRLLQGVTEENDISNRGIIETDGMTALNWTDMPSASISLGFLSNEDDEKNLADEDYRKKLVTGLANGIDYYFK